MHVLYHVADLLKALEELKRVLQEGGWCLITTVAEGAGKELLDLHNGACENAGAGRWKIANLPSSRFNLSNGHTLVSRVFPSVELTGRQANLRFPDSDSLLTYYKSMEYFRNVRDADPQTANELLIHVKIAAETEIAEKTCFHVSKDCGTWLCHG